MMHKTADYATIKGLVLAGGRSTRMGQDKGLLSWHGKPQREYLVDLLSALNIPTFISCRADQVDGLQGYPLIVDQLEGKGPLAAVHAAFSRFPDVAWLVVACDMPLLDTDTIRYLLKHRNPEAPATAFQAPAFSDASPDPLLAIWEPAMFGIVRERLEADVRCARKALIHAGVHLLMPPRPEVLSNINTPEEMERLSTLKGLI
ncbi:MAG: molybdenum cofactor guanylyltransferase [Bacteroidetes bacterium]|nr:MAG: molybdenum cofactor guanylyltransferase [Bacteroidota bacterium]